ncbi:MAG: hypothetical protein K9M13_01700, partial [Simkaniaceae bacterium]|nr:hypothetical protein [Simkaniaceae bacterium]
VRFTIISPKHRKEEKYYRANLFDTLAGAIRSFYGPHSVTPFISHRDGYKVSIIDNRSERGVSDLSSHSQNRFLRLETLVRKRIAEFFSKVQSHEDTCEDKFNTLYPRPRSPMSSPVDTHAGLWASQ